LKCLIGIAQGGQDMSIDLPEPIAAYFAACKADIETVMRCFTPDAVVKDEGHTYNGIDSIRRWKVGTATKFTYSSVPFALVEQGGMLVVTSRLTGNFPGSPIDLRFFFRLERDKISALEIVP
jgi:SnoaL-like domain